MLLDIFFFIFSVWICSSIIAAGVIRSERERVEKELGTLIERSRKKRVDELYGRDDD